MTLPDTAAWRALAAHAPTIPPLTALFAADPDRLARMSASLEGLQFDFSKLLASAQTLTLLGTLVQEADLAGWRARLLGGEIVNPAENRAATHAAERGTGPASITDPAAAAHAKTRALVDQIRRDGKIRHILHLGIGGSALGPALLVDALKPDLAFSVVSNIDGAALEPVLKSHDPATTLLIVTSKTFTTVETMTNAASAMAWLGPDALDRTVAVTAAPDKARAFGIPDDRILSFAETVGGRYSLWSAVGVPAALGWGWEGFQALLDGAAAMDRHFAETPFEANAPVIAAMLDVLHATVLGMPTRAVFAYDERLKLLPSYLQQLEMESNGKRVTRDGAPVTWPTAPITWGGVGTDAQHAVFQLLHQGTHVQPTEFLAVIEPGHHLDADHHKQLLSNCFAQGAALLRGRTTEEALPKSGNDPALAQAKTFTGNRPSATILLDKLDHRTLGALLAFYEHRTFAAGVLLGINPFDQWGVELGKEMATAMGKGDAADFDPSTRDLMKRAFG